MHRDMKNYKTPSNPFAALSHGVLYTSPSERVIAKEQAFGRCPNFIIISAKSAPGIKRYLVPVGNPDRD
jgi:hypothetical protein